MKKAVPIAGAPSGAGAGIRTERPATMAGNDRNLPAKRFAGATP